MRLGKTTFFILVEEALQDVLTSFAQYLIGVVIEIDAVPDGARCRDRHASRYGFEDVVELVRCEAKRLRDTYAGSTVAPLVYSLGDRSLCQIAKAGQSIATVHRTVKVERGEERR